MDCAFGRPAEGVPVSLLREVDAVWRHEVSLVTDDTGCASTAGSDTPRGRYRLVLDLDKYFPALGVEPFQSRVDVTFRRFHVTETVHVLMAVTPSSSVVCRLVTAGRTNGQRN